MPSLSSLPLPLSAHDQAPGDLLKSLLIQEADDDAPGSAYIETMRALVDNGINPLLKYNCLDHEKPKKVMKKEDILQTILGMKHE